MRVVEVESGCIRRNVNLIDSMTSCIIGLVAYRPLLMDEMQWMLDVLHVVLILIDHVLRYARIGMMTCACDVHVEKVRSFPNNLDLASRSDDIMPALHM